MKQEELIKQMDDEIKAANLAIDKAGRIMVEDIEKIESGMETYSKGDKTISSKRFYLTVRGRDVKVMMPYSAMSQLQELMRQHKVKAFSVLKTGSDLSTRYNVAPEFE